MMYPVKEIKITNLLKSCRLIENLVIHKYLVLVIE